MKAIENHLNTNRLINKLLATLGVYIAVILLTIHTYSDDMKYYFKILIVLLAFLFVLVLIGRPFLIRATEENKLIDKKIDDLLQERSKKTE